MSSGGGVAGLRKRWCLEVVAAGAVMVELPLIDFERGRRGERTGRGGEAGRGSWSRVNSEGGLVMPTRRE